MLFEWHVTAGFPQLDVYTLSEDWALAASCEGHWKNLARSVGLQPSRWIDSHGDRMYGAVIWLRTRFDLKKPVLEDDSIECACRFDAVHKPYSLSRTTFAVGGVTKAQVELLTVFIKRQSKGSNRKFSKTRGLWLADDYNAERIHELVDLHHEMKNSEILRQAKEKLFVSQVEINRIRDFNTADILYFKNFVAIAKAAEWAKGRGHPVRLPRERSCWYFGNVSDGDIVKTKVVETLPGRCTTEHRDPRGQRIFLCVTDLDEAVIPVR